jgi:hypothetical protein
MNPVNKILGKDVSKDNKIKGRNKNYDTFGNRLPIFMNKCSRCKKYVQERDIEQYEPVVCKDCWNDEDNKHWNEIRNKVF